MTAGPTSSHQHGALGAVHPRMHNAFYRASTSHSAVVVHAEVMTDCQTTFGLLQTSELNQTFSKSSDQMSSFSATTEHSSPPYSQTGTEQMQYSTPESHYNDQRTETPSSDHLNIEFTPNNGYSPDVATSSDRDESPDTISTSSGGAPELHAEPTDVKPVISVEDSELQRQIMRLQGFQESVSSDKSSAPINLLAAFNNSLLSDKLSASLLSENMKSLPSMSPMVSTPSAIPLGASLPPPSTAPADVTPTKRKRQRRNPVWPYFDVIDGTARCKQCLYSTKSVFSTNLKVHLRSHHRPDYEKVIEAEDALNLNAILLSGNSGKLFSTDLTRKRLPPMTSSIMMTMNKLLSQQGNDESNPLHSVLRQQLAAGNLSHQIQQVQNQIVQQAAQQQQRQQQQQQKQHFPLNAANLEALNNFARNQLLNQQHQHQQQQQQQAQSNGMSGMTAEQFISQFNFPNPQVKNEIASAPHGTDANGMPQPKRRRLRRHPVWMFFRDLEDRMVGCINCNFRTGSAFSTNLKMHLKAHHKEDYERVLKLEDDMRIEEGIFGPPNKMKTELIDFIRGGGNASTPPSNAKPSVQQIISQAMGNRSTPIKKECADDDPFNGMSMSDKLAALVGLAPPAGAVEGEIADEKPALPIQASTMPNVLEELRRAAERISAANMGLQPPPQEQTMVNLNGSIMQSDNKSSSSASTDVCDDKKTDRDRALARYWLEQGGSEELLQGELFKALLQADDTSLQPTTSASDCPVLERMSPLAEVAEEDLPKQDFDVYNEADEPTSSTAAATDGLSVSAVFDISTLTYEGIFDALSSFERSLGLSESTSCTVLVQLLRNSAATPLERSLVETVASSLLKIAEFSSETNRSERMRKLVSEKMKLKRLFESDEQRERRLQRMRERYRQSRVAGDVSRGHSVEESPAVGSTASLSPALILGDDAKEEKLQRLREYQRRRLERETPEQREKRLAKMRQNQKRRREKQNAAKAEQQGGLDLLRALAPDYEIPEPAQLAALVEEEGSLTTVGMH